MYRATESKRTKNSGREALKPMGEALRFGILGAARIAPHALVQPARAVEGICVQAVAARDAERARAFAARHQIPRVHASYAALLADPEVDAVYIPLPNGLHHEWALRALDAGKHVLCEKPLAANATQAEELATAAARPHAPVFMEAFHNRYHPFVQRICAAIESGAVGAVQSLTALFRTPMLRRTDIRFEYDLAGGATMDLGCYMVNLLRCVMDGEPTVERAEAIPMRPEVDRRMRAELRFPSGAAAHMEVEMRALRLPDIRLIVQGERGTITAVNPVLPHLYHRFTVRTASGVRREIFPRTPTYTYQLRAFLAAVRDDAPFPTTAADGVRTMRVIDAIYRRAGLTPRG